MPRVSAVNKFFLFGQLQNSCIKQNATVDEGENWCGAGNPQQCCGVNILERWPLPYGRGSVAGCGKLVTANWPWNFLAALSYAFAAESSLSKEPRYILRLLSWIRAFHFLWILSHSRPLYFERVFAFRLCRLQRFWETVAGLRGYTKQPKTTCLMHLAIRNGLFCGAD